LNFISERKADHLRIAAEAGVDHRAGTGLEALRLRHRALPERDLADVDISIRLLDRPLAAPVLVSAMTGGVPEAAEVNRRLLGAAAEHGIGLTLGSGRALLEDPSLLATYRPRDVPRPPLLLANLGASQMGDADSASRLVELLGADGLSVHLNPLQEAVQPEGNVNFAGLLSRIEAVCRALPVPVVVKEVGWGISADVARLLCSAGVAAIDVAGAGGTSWSEVERHRARSERDARVAGAFASWGIGTAESLSAVRAAAPSLPIFASGGMRNGVDVAKALALGASLAGLASPVLRAATVSAEAVVVELEATIRELRISMFCIGSGSLDSLRDTPHLIAM
jgi:isopentenyl-diphosphate delta-isomerase